MGVDVFDQGNHIIGAGFLVYVFAVGFNSPFADKQRVGNLPVIVFPLDQPDNFQFSISQVILSARFLPDQVLAICTGQVIAVITATHGYTLKRSDQLAGIGAVGQKTGNMLIAHYTFGHRFVVIVHGQHQYFDQRKPLFYFTSQLVAPHITQYIDQ